MYDNGAKEVSTGPRGLGQIHRQTLRERLEEQKRALEGALADVNEALGFIDKNPEFEKFHNVVGKAGY